MSNTVDFVSITTKRYNELHARKYRGEKLTSAEWLACAKDLKTAAETFEACSDYYNFCNDRASDCEYQASRMS